jgi:hypothetical protein
VPSQQIEERWLPTFETAEEPLGKQNKGAPSGRGETNRRAADDIDIGGIYNGK